MPQHRPPCSCLIVTFILGMKAVPTSSWQSQHGVQGVSDAELEAKGRSGPCLCLPTLPSLSVLKTHKAVQLGLLWFPHRGQAGSSRDRCEASGSGVAESRLQRSPGYVLQNQKAHPNIHVPPLTGSRPGNQLGSCPGPPLQTLSSFLTEVQARAGHQGACSLLSSSPSMLRVLFRGCPWYLRPSALPVGEQQSGLSLSLAPESHRCTKVPTVRALLISLQGLLYFLFQDFIFT